VIYLSIFFSAFIAATFLPAFSELALAASLSSGVSIFLLWLAATCGNTLGSCVNWYIGREILRFKNKRWFPVSQPQLERAQIRFNRFGMWTLLLAWLPIVGDPLTLVAGMMRVRFVWFLLLVGIGKGLRYGVIVWLYIRWAGYT